MKTQWCYRINGVWYMVQVNPNLYNGSKGATLRLMGFLQETQ